MGHRTQRSTCYLIVYFKYFVTYLNTGVSRGQWKITAAAIVWGHLIYLLREVQITVIMFYNTAEYDVFAFQCFARIYVNYYNNVTHWYTSPFISSKNQPTHPPMKMTKISRKSWRKKLLTVRPVIILFHI